MPEMEHGEKSYPNLYLDWGNKYELPESGELTVKFRKTSETMSKDKSGERQSVTLEIREICGVKAGGKKSEKDEDEDGGKALDKLREEVEDSEDYD